MRKIISLSLFLFLLNLSGCQEKQVEIEKKKITIQTKDKINNIDLPQLDTNIKKSNNIVDIKTNYGMISVALFPDLAPKAVENFIKHANTAYYDGTVFHRVVKDFVIQGGDPEGTGQGGKSIWNDQFSPEISKQLYHLNGALAMARTEGTIKQKTQGSQFYIVSNSSDQTETIKNHKKLKQQYPDLLTEEDYPDAILDAYKKGGTPTLDNQYTVFGQVINGMDIVRKIASVNTIDDKPIKKIVIESIRTVK